MKSDSCASLRALIRANDPKTAQNQSPDSGTTNDEKGVCTAMIELAPVFFVDNDMCLNTTPRHTRSAGRLDCSVPLQKAATAVHYSFGTEAACRHSLTFWTSRPTVPPKQPKSRARRTLTPTRAGRRFTWQGSTPSARDGRASLHTRDRLLCVRSEKRSER